MHDDVRYLVEEKLMPFSDGLHPLSCCRLALGAKVVHLVRHLDYELPRIREHAVRVHLGAGGESQVQVAGAQVAVEQLGSKPPADRGLSAGSVVHVDRGVVKLVCPRVDVAEPPLPAEEAVLVHPASHNLGTPHRLGVVGDRVHDAPSSRAPARPVQNALGAKPPTPALEPPCNFASLTGYHT